ncbi:MAG: MBL fold metallo-hydrolase [Oceanicoccus sp.]
MKCSITLLFTILIPALVGCSASSLTTEPAALGQKTTLAEIAKVINTPGPIVFEKHLAAHWAINLSGLLNLDSPKAIAAGIDDRDEAIEIYTYSIVHPDKGLYLIDSGISEGFVNPEVDNGVPFYVAMAMGMDKLRVEKTTGALLMAHSSAEKASPQQVGQQNSSAIAGVFLTHIHIDHIMGLLDLSASTAIYTGPNEASTSSFQHVFTQPTTDNILSKFGILQEWQFDDGDVVDVFGDASVFAIHVPGHTPGSTAYLIRSTTGPQLILGDASHTSWGWNNAVEPGTFSNNQPQSAVSLAKLLDLSNRHPSITVHPGHQSL